MDAEHRDVGIPIRNSVHDTRAGREQVGAGALPTAASGTLALPPTAATPIGNREQAGTLALPETAAGTAADGGIPSPYGMGWASRPTKRGRTSRRDTQTASKSMSMS